MISCLSCKQSSQRCRTCRRLKFISAGSQHWLVLRLHVTSVCLLQKVTLGEFVRTVVDDFNSFKELVTLVEGSRAKAIIRILCDYEINDDVSEGDIFKSFNLENTTRRGNCSLEGSRAGIQQHRE